MATERLPRANESRSSLGKSPSIVVAVCVLIVSVMALAFSVGRHFPISPAVKTDEMRVPVGGSLEPITQRSAIAYDRLEVDRGGAKTNSFSAASVSTTRQARRGDRDDD